MYKMNEPEDVKLPSCGGVASLKTEIFQYIWLRLCYIEVTFLMVTVLSSKELSEWEPDCLGAFTCRRNM